MSSFRLQHTDRIVSAFLLAVLGTLTAAVFFVVRDQGLFKRRIEYRTVFADGGGLKPETPVRIAGIEVGSVRKVTLTKEDKVEVVFDVLEEYADRLTADPSDGSCPSKKASMIDSEEQRKATETAKKNCGARVAASVPAGLGAFLPTSGLVIEVGNRNNARISKGGFVPADESEGLAELIERLQKEGVVQNARDIILQVDALLKNINDPDGSIQQTLAHVATVTGRAAEGKGLVGELTRDNSPTQRQIAASLEKLDKALADLQLSAANIQQVTAGVSGRTAEIDGFITRLSGFADDAATVGKDLSTFASDARAIPPDVRAAIANLNSRIDDLGVIVRGLKNTFPFNMVGDDEKKPAAPARAPAPERD